MELGKTVVHNHHHGVVNGSVVQVGVVEGGMHVHPVTVSTVTPRMPLLRPGQ
jgi:hypothetical protein